MKIFLEQICPLLIEAISGLKDFEFDIETPEQIDYDQQTSKAKELLKENSQDQPIFMMDHESKMINDNNENIDDFINNFEEATSLPSQQEPIKPIKKLAFSLNQQANSIQNLDLTKHNSVSQDK